MRGRRPDAVGQAEKGNPGKRGKRKGPTVAERLKLLAEAPAASGEAFSPPALLGLEEFSGAIRIWHEFQPILQRRNILNRTDRHTLAMFCYYLDRFWSAVAQLAQDGETQKVKTVAGGYMLRDHPAVRHRDEAAKVVFDLSVRFGLTPLDRHKLIREMAGAGVPLGGLFGDEGGQQAQQPAAPASPTPATAADDDSDDIVGFARRHAATPGRPH